METIATTPARMFGLYPRKGIIAPGSDADIVLYDPAARTRISVDTHHMNMDYSAWEGYEIAGKVDTVISRGKVIVGGRRAITGAPATASSCAAASPTTSSDERYLESVWTSVLSSSVTRPRRGVVELAKKAEAAGFSHVWTFDSHVLWQEPFVIYSKILADTERVIVGPMVTNPSTRDWTVIASQFATLNEMYGNRTVCGIGRGDSAVRVLGLQPTTLAELRESVQVIRALGNGEKVWLRDRELQFAWAPDSRLEVWVAAYGPKALALTGEVGDGYILQLADPDIAAWMIKAVRAAAAKAGRDPDAITFCVAAPAYVGDDLAHQRDQTRWFGGMVGNHVADIVDRYGAGGAVPTVLTDYIKGRKGYDYAEHGRAGNTHTDFVPDEVVDRFCILGPVDAHLRAAGRAAGVGRRPVRRLPAARREGIDARGVRRAHHPGGFRPLNC